VFSLPLVSYYLMPTTRVLDCPGCCALFPIVKGHPGNCSTLQLFCILFWGWSSPFSCFFLLSSFRLVSSRVFAVFKGGVLSPQPLLTLDYASLSKKFSPCGRWPPVNILHFFVCFARSPVDGYSAVPLSDCTPVPRFCPPPPFQKLYFLLVLACHRPRLSSFFDRGGISAPPVPLLVGTVFSPVQGRFAPTSSVLSFPALFLLPNPYRVPSKESCYLYQLDWSSHFRGSVFLFW